MQASGLGNKNNNRMLHAERPEGDMQASGLGNNKNNNRMLHAET